MQRVDIDDLPNPFTLDQLSKRPKPTSLAKRLTFFASIAVLLASSLMLGHQYSKYRISRLSTGFASLSSPDKLERLDQLSAWGRQAIPTIAGALIDNDAQVAARAHEVLRRMQNDWTVLEFDETVENQAALVDSICAEESALTDERRKLAIDLLQRVAHFSVEQNDEPTRRLYFNATAAIDKLSSSVTLAADKHVSGESIQIDERKRPLPVSHLARGVDWTDWPPRADTSFTSPASVAQASTPQAAVQTARPTIHQASMSPLQIVPDSELVVLHEVRQDRTHPVEDQRAGESMYDPPTTIQPVAHVVETAWQDANLATIIKSLALPDQDLQDQAKTELARRGLGEVEISLALRIASADTPSKIALIESMPRASEIDARPWLMMLLDDHNREVRLRAVSALATIKDPWVQQQLKLKMVDEQDQTVAFRIRRVLNLR